MRTARCLVASTHCSCSHLFLSCGFLRSMSNKVFLKLVHTFITLGSSCHMYVSSEVFQQFSGGSGSTREREMCKHTGMPSRVRVQLLAGNPRRANIWYELIFWTVIHKRQMLPFSFLSEIPSKRKIIYLLITFVYDSMY